MPHGTGAPLGAATSIVPKDARRAAADVANALLHADSVLVLGHRGADGDVVGSSLGIANALREMGKRVVVYNELELPSSYSWLPGADGVVHSLDDDAAFDATIVVDTADETRCGKHFPSRARRGVFVWIDHHAHVAPPGDVNFIDLTSAAVGEQIVAVLDAMGHPLSFDVAQCVYASLVADTGGFRYSNTSARAFSLAARLVEAGVDPWEHTEMIFESQHEGRVRLIGAALSRIKRTPSGEYGFSVLVDADFDAHNAGRDEAQGIVNHIRGIRGVEVAALVVELKPKADRPGDCRVILRSRGRRSCAPIAERFGMTGHRNAATFELHGPVDEVVARLERVFDDEESRRSAVPQLALHTQHVGERTIEMRQPTSHPSST